MQTWEKMRAVVKKRMSDEGIKQKFIAEKCGFDEKTFCLMIAGKKVITGADIEQFCYGMGIQFTDVLTPRIAKKSTTA
jgi:hypothetical protein